MSSKKGIIVASITDIDITGRVKKLGGNILGEAHENFVTAILMRLGFDVAKVNLRAAPFDILITAYKNGLESEEVLLKAQVKTCKGSMPFTGGGRGGIDRKYISGVKTYMYSEKHHDLLIGVNRRTLDVYLLPTRFIQHFKTRSKSLKQLAFLKNNWEILLNWRDEYLEGLRRRGG